METLNKTVSTAYKCLECNSVDSIRFLKTTHYCGNCYEADGEIKKINGKKDKSAVSNIQ